jgi:hypothetical protein
MTTAKRIDEFTPEEVTVLESVIWLTVKLTPGKDYNEYKALPEIAEYNGVKFYKMAFNSDKHIAYYKEAKNNPYHLRYN